MQGRPRDATAPSSCSVWRTRRLALQVRVLLQKPAQDRVHLELLGARRRAEEEGAHVTWSTQVLRPGRAPGMQDEGVEDVVLYSFLVGGAA